MAAPYTLFDWTYLRVIISHIVDLLVTTILITCNAGSATSSKCLSIDLLADFFMESCCIGRDLTWNWKVDKKRCSDHIKTTLNYVTFHSAIWKLMLLTKMSGAASVNTRLFVLPGCSRRRSTIAQASPSQQYQPTPVPYVVGFAHLHSDFAATSAKTQSTANSNLHKNVPTMRTNAWGIHPRHPQLWLLSTAS